MKSSSCATLGSIALVIGFIGGCAGTPTAPSESTWDVANRPQMLMPGAVRSDVKGLAMGAARSKGWTITKSTEDRLVVQRPVDPGSAAAAALGASASAIPPVIEVTSAFVQRSDGVLVALGAELVSQPPGEKAPTRVDYTETYRDALTRSLESLRSNWAANRQRVAGSTPTQAVRAEGEAERSDGGQANSNPLVQAWADTLEEEKASKGASTAGGDDPGARVLQVRRATDPEGPRNRSPGSLPSPRAPPPSPRRRSPHGRSRAPRPPPHRRPRCALEGLPPWSRAASPCGEGLASSEPVRVTGTALPTAPVQSVPPDQNMLTLNQSGGTGTWAYYAEQYARLRGCDVTDGGAVLIESRSDSEIHKVPCAGSDSFLVKCQSGVCRGLE